MERDDQLAVHHLALALAERDARAHRVDPRELIDAFLHVEPVRRLAVVQKKMNKENNTKSSDIPAEAAFAILKLLL